MSVNDTVRPPRRVTLWPFALLVVLLVGAGVWVWQHWPSILLQS
ncbi:MAG TPA: nickel transporter, partial [Erwinia persicina]|nr:nickel transporter [Erwinia persicina]